MLFFLCRKLSLGYFSIRVQSVYNVRMMMRLQIVAFPLLAISILVISQNVTAQETGWKDAEIISLPKTVLPKEAKASGLGGKVSVVVTVDEKGAVAGAYEATGPDWTCPQIERPDVVALRNAAKALAWKAKFKPATQDGKPVISTATIDFQFGTSKPAPATGTQVGPPVFGKVPDPEMTMRPDGPTKPAGEDVYGVVTRDRDKVAIGPDSTSQETSSSTKTVSSRTATGGLAASGNSRTSGQSQTISGGVLNGKALALPRPKYPPAARAVRATGAVSVLVLIDEDGNIFSANPVSGHPLLRGESVKAACGARFSPTLLMGQPVKVSGIITYNYIP